MSLEDTLNNLSIYDAKKYFRKAQNVMFNYTEMEAKVREATNNEPWGASSTLMEQIAQGTYNIRERDEILNMTFKRFTEKTASEWRQIYKSLQLLEYLIKHGSERFIDDVRTSLSLIKMLESFHYIDSQGRDQGINVRNKAQTLAAFLRNDVQIRSERKKARETLQKFKGVAGGAAADGMVHNPRAGFNASHSNGVSVSADFDSDEEDSTSAPAPRLTSSAAGITHSDDLFSFHDTTAQTTQPNSANNGKEQQNDEEEEEDFADFQSAAPVVQQTQPQMILQQPFTLLDDFSSLPATQPNHQAMDFPEVIPAIATDTKKADPFGSLFMTAKAIKEPIKHVVQRAPAPQPQTHITPTATEENDDDLFGDMTSAAPTSTTSGFLNPPAETAKNTNTNEEIDLLDF